MFRLFFNRLTTAISEMTLYINKNKTPRTTFDIHVKSFENVVEREEKALKKNIPNIRAQKKGKKVAHGNDEDGGAVDLGNRKSSADKILDALSVSPEKFHAMFRNAVSLMPKKVERTTRLGPILYERLVVMAGIAWNQGSKNYTRDYKGVAIAAIMESFFIPLYRKDMLKSSRAARAFRSELHEYFQKHLQPFVGFGPDPVRGRSHNALTFRAVSEWAFCDDIPLVIPLPQDAPEMDVPVYNPDLLHMELATTSKVVDKTVKNPLRSFVTSAEKNRFLAAFDPEANPGTLESAAHYYLTRIAEVRHLFLLLYFLPFPSVPSALIIHSFVRLCIITCPASPTRRSTRTSLSIPKTIHSRSSSVALTCSPPTFASTFVPFLSFLSPHTLTHPFS